MSDVELGDIVRVTENSRYASYGDVGVLTGIRLEDGEVEYRVHFDLRHGERHGYEPNYRGKLPGVLVTSVECMP